MDDKFFYDLLPPADLSMICVLSVYQMWCPHSRERILWVEAKSDAIIYECESCKAFILRK